jgi:hypothetical protein
MEMSLMLAFCTETIYNGGSRGYLLEMAINGIKQSIWMGFAESAEHGGHLCCRTWRIDIRNAGSSEKEV